MLSRYIDKSYEDKLAGHITEELWLSKNNDWRLQQTEIQRNITRLATEREVLLENGLVGMAKVKDRMTGWHNNALASLFGYESRELVGTPTRLLYPDEGSFERIGQAYVQLKDLGQYRTQLQMRRKNGSNNLQIISRRRY